MVNLEAHAVAGGAHATQDDPSRPVLDQLTDKWSMTVLAALSEPKRFNEIRRHLDGVTQRVLTQTLRRLERNGMITRRVLPTSPVGVEYSLTRLGASLREPLRHLHDWAVENSDEIRASQRAYDQRMPAQRTHSAMTSATPSATAQPAASARDKAAP
jgi:DNA-binding HxlR family transcriptional regulator